MLYPGSDNRIGNKKSQVESREACLDFDWINIFQRIRWLRGNNSGYRLSFASIINLGCGKKHVDLFTLTIFSLPCLQG
jgi:hypothetical protein